LIIVNARKKKRCRELTAMQREQREQRRVKRAQVVARALVADDAILLKEWFSHPAMPHDDRVDMIMDNWRNNFYR